MCYEPGYENLFFQLTARHPEPDNPNWKLFRTEGEVTVYRIIDDYNNCVWEKDIRPDGIRYSLGIYEDNPITQIRSYERIPGAKTFRVPVILVANLAIVELIVDGVRRKFPMPLDTFKELVKS